MAYYYATVEERIMIGHLSRASPDEVYKWFEKVWTPPRESSSPSSLSSGMKYENDIGRKLLEYILIRRNEPIIEYAIARFGYSINTIQFAYDIGDTATRLAAIFNPRGNIALRQANSIIREAKFDVMQSLVRNPFLTGDFFENLFYRKNEYAGISDDRLMAIVFRIAGNGRHQRSYDQTYLDGYAEFSYNQAFVAAWDLAKSVPVSRHWASALEGLLTKCERPFGFKDIEETIARWNIDEPIEGPPDWWKRNSPFRLRVLLAGFLKANDNLLSSDDPALRCSFYQRFSPSQFREWPEFLNKDGSEFVYAALENDSLWKTPKERERLKEVANWGSPHINDRSDLPNFDRGKKKHLREKYPGLFDDEHNDPMRQAIKLLEERIDSLSEQISGLQQTKFSLF